MEKLHKIASESYEETLEKTKEGKQHTEKKTPPVKNCKLMFTVYINSAA